MWHLFLVRLQGLGEAGERVAPARGGVRAAAAGAGAPAARAGAPVARAGAPGRRAGPPAPSRPRCASYHVVNIFDTYHCPIEVLYLIFSYFSTCRYSRNNHYHI